MRMISLLSALSFAALAINPAAADAARTGLSLTISEVVVIGTNARILFVNGISGNAPSCLNPHPTRTNQFGINLSTPKGRAQLQLATAALLGGKSVNVTGLETCMTVDGSGVWQELDQITLLP